MSCNKILITKPKIEFLHYPQVISCELLYSVYCLNLGIIQKILQYDTLLISSLNGAKSLIQNLCLYANTSIFDVIKKKHVLSIGKKTYEFLKEHSFENLFLPFDTLQSLIMNVNLRNVLYLSGYHTTFENWCDYSVKRIIIYKAIERKLNNNIKHMIYSGEISHIVLYSKRSAELLLNNFFKDYDFLNIQFICMSENVASLLKHYSAIFPETPTEKSMNNLIQKILKS